jgi:hypothetical protein
MYARRRVAWALLTLILVASLPSMAFGHVYYQGDDYSVPINNRHQMGICDHERDLNEAYTKFHLTDGGLRRWRDGNGANAPCARSYVYRLKVFDHKTCEARTVRPDVCNKKYMR